MAGDAEDVGARDCESEKGQSRALGGEGEEPEKDWVSAELIGGEMALEGAGSGWLLMTISTSSRLLIA